MWSRDDLSNNRLLGIFLIACLVSWLTPDVQAKGVQVPKEDSKPSQAVSAPPKPLTDADYYQPLENWLKQQGSPLNGREIYEVAKANHLDPDFLIAVTKAETNLGKVRQRGSSCNVGSVGSYDSTDTTFSCTSHREGLQQIASTVNNKLLGHYTKVSELSRSHNPNQKPVYASSDGNWFRNCLTTMNALKGLQREDYEFRR